MGDILVFGFGGGGVRVVVRAGMRIIFGVLVLIAGGGLVEGIFAHFGRCSLVDDLSMG